MNVFLTFDVEIWCNGWKHLDQAFPGSFDRYIYGHSRHGDYALPETLAILNQHGLPGVFFVEPLFAARFGFKHLKTVVDLIQDAGQEVQLHLHPEWTNEALEPILENSNTKRQHMSDYSLQEQTQLIAHGKRMVEEAKGSPITAFRSGGYAANRDTFSALKINDICLDSTLNRCFGTSAPELRQEHDFNAPFTVQGVTTFPVTVMHDGFGNSRPAQVGACSFNEMQDGLQSARAKGIENFVVVSHNFEMLKDGSCEPDWIVAKRFRLLCELLASAPDRFTVRRFDDDLHPGIGKGFGNAVPQTNWFSTGQRYFEQARRRLNWM